MTFLRAIAETQPVTTKTAEIEQRQLLLSPGRSREFQSLPETAVPAPGAFHLRQKRTDGNNRMKCLGGLRIRREGKHQRDSSETSKPFLPSERLVGLA